MNLVLMFWKMHGYTYEKNMKDPDFTTGEDTRIAKEPSWNKR